MSTDIQELNRLIKENLHIDNYDKSKGWMISKSKLSGRGVFATKDFQPGDIILKDVPLVTGPRAGTNAKIHCVICMRNNNLRACSRGCGLPMCSPDCEKNLNHAKECEFITNRSVGVKFENVSYALFRGLTPIRSFLMADLQLKLLLQLSNHDDEQHGFEVGLIKSKIQLKDEEADVLKKICCVLDANAFETMVDTKECFDDLCIRGLYPIASLLNHNCAPNTTHLFDENQTMIVKATVPIARCTEIFTSYTTMLWATAARRHHLMQTKHFECNCKRCEDPKEFGACLSALRCTNPKNCDGALYPLDPLDEEEKWQCAKCKFKISKSSMAIIQSALGSLLTTVDVTAPDQLMDLLQKRIQEVVPITNHIVIELKCRVIWMLGRAKGYLWHGKNLNLQLDFEHYF